MIFEKATRKKLRFVTNKGHISVEDLWDLSLEQLNELAKKLNKELKDEQAEEDFLEDEENKKESLVKLRFEVVISILKTKKHEAKERENEVLRKAQKEKLLEVIAKKQDSALAELSEEELKKRLDELS